MAGGQECPPNRFRTSPFGLESIATKRQIENAASHRTWLARIGLAHALERLRWDRLKSRFSFAQASGWLRIGRDASVFGCHDRIGSLLPLPPPDSGVVPFSG